MEFLITISLGPVQDFIAAARRTSDLWAGSQLLVDLAKEIAKLLDIAGANLIFPSNANSDGPNKILAEIEVEDETQIKAIVNTVKETAREVLLKRFDDELKKLSIGQRELVVYKRAIEQLDSFLEIYAAWMPLQEDNYTEKRKKLDALLAGRKALREFAPAPGDDAGIPKSSLDPSRAVVLKRFKENVSDSFPLQLKKSELLDAVSLLKRIEGTSRKEEVPDTTSMAQRAIEPGFLLSNHFSSEEEREKYIPGCSYYAIILADGDKMGDRISKAESVAEHRIFSGKLAAFAKGVDTIIKGHDGFLIYAGGDDVLAFVPVTKAISCAQKLAKNFNDLIGTTLSAGIAIVHHKEPLARSLEAARGAESAAKVQRNSLAVALHTRGGAPLTVAAQWSNEEEDWEDRQQHYKNEELPRGLAYDLAELAREWQHGEMESCYLRGEAERIWKRKIATSEKLPLPVYATANAEALQKFADKLKIARFLNGIKEGNAS